MKKVIFLFVFIFLGLQFQSQACQTIKGTAVVVQTGENTYKVTCPGDCICAKINCNGNDIDVYTTGGVIHGTLGMVNNPVSNSDGTISVDSVIFNL
jgi:hypothetical protein